ncbi:restriction endonuclease [Paenibacillus alba]|uniref:Restriction endonuclease n=1 Tax=Paenibacillus alba TaxID=1197127 RepID=A0ABU6FZM5_9BACL|nr:restriction endonuclease [Paenibacillus alba]MEC0227359.1 restriction endonuclease [Paenibacillus alba]
MARTYYAEGRQVAYIIRGLCVLTGLSIFYFTSLKEIWWMFFVIIFSSVLVGEIFGARWTRKRRADKKARKQQRTTSPVKSSPSNNKKVLSDSELLKVNIDSLSGTDFERLMMLYYKDQGYQVERIGGSGDHEVDLIIKGKEGYKIAVQCKRWKRDVGNDIVLRLKAGKQVHGCYDAWIVTTSNYTRAAKEAAEKLNIKLINGLMLDDKLKRWKAQKGIS